MAFRQGALRIVDPVVGSLELRGDGFAAAGELITLIVVPEVQRWLDMTPEEIVAARDAVEEFRSGLTTLYAQTDPAPPESGAIHAARRTTTEALESVLGESRLRRLRALSWRILDGDALLDPDVAEFLGLTPEHRADLSARAEANACEVAARQREYRGARLASVDALHESIAQLEANLARQLLDVLSPSQRSHFEQLRADHAPR
jgi:hypothetical protein